MAQGTHNSFIPSPTIHWLSAEN